MAQVTLHQYKNIKISDDSVSDKTAWSSQKTVDYLDPGAFGDNTLSVRLRRGTKEQMFESSCADYEVVYTTDSNEAFVYNGTSFRLLGACGIGLHANRPDPVTDGKMFFETDTQTLFLCNSGTWLQLTYSSSAISQHINAAAPHSGHATLSESGLVEQNPMSASTTPSPNSIPISLEDSKIELGWLPDIDAGALA